MLKILHRTVARISWDEIDWVVTKADFIPKFDDAPYLVMFV